MVLHIFALHRAGRQPRSILSRLALGRSNLKPVSLDPHYRAFVRQDAEAHRRVQVALFVAS